MSTTIAKANPKVGFVSLGCPSDCINILSISTIYPSIYAGFQLILTSDTGFTS
ncbi:hypothetical protein [Pseudomonas carnis]|uniref:hypothetical protein n=1 Tax=Pseudomonas carnis TaxID=2487355 RepID=UPI001D4915D8|nr:hypothetical protein [Pseudomonas carnis]CAH0127012.1 hypothetical protein SRABI111_00104 [Pseudomonas carnis]CAH0139706.1 hypothetical protein SRABI64_00261 [Pseudomonas carnis]CAH0146993.1 hypothetical protein SRABI08_00604 [Pseudomonas carnis]CAH0176571.1 hypothetical protein SRABI110_01401 [Pseudomonas carnis]